jgi:hypothetical protein
MAFIPNVIQFYREAPTAPCRTKKSADFSLDKKRVQITDRSEAILAEARSLIGKTFQLNARDPLATDCGGMMIEICKRLELRWEDLGRHYDLSDCGGQALYVHLRGCTNEVPVADALPGDMLLLSIRHLDYPQHLAIFAGSTIIHSNPSFTTRAITEQPFTDEWVKRVYAVFRFRGLKEAAKHTAPLHMHVPCEACVRENPRAFTKRRMISFAKTCAH